MIRIESGCGASRPDSRAAGTEVSHTIGVSLTASKESPIFVLLPLFLLLIRITKDLSRLNWEWLPVSYLSILISPRFRR
jgi:hypothetical protein